MQYKISKGEKVLKDETVEINDQKCGQMLSKHAFKRNINKETNTTNYEYTEA